MPEQSYELRTLTGSEDDKKESKENFEDWIREIIRDEIKNIALSNPVKLHPESCRLEDGHRLPPEMGGLVDIIGFFGQSEEYKEYYAKNYQRPKGNVAP